MAISAVQTDAASSLVSGLNGTAASATGSTTELSDRFLKLLVTQLKNQDPMNPMENAELTSQLAQMSTVEGISKLNTTMDGLVAQFKSNQVLQGAALIGRQVLAEGNQLDLGAAGAAGGVNLASSADQVKVDILNNVGQVLRSYDLGDQDAGMVRFAWDGLDASGNQLAEGVYKFTVSATAADKTVEATAYSLAQVLSVSLADDGLDVELSVLGNQSLDNIKQIF